MKKKFSVSIIIVVILCLVAVYACACGGSVDKEGTMTLAVVNGESVKEYSVDLSDLGSGDEKSTGLMVILEHLKNKGELTYTSIDGPYGAYLTQVNELKEGNGAYISLYTDVEDDVDVSEYATHFEYKDKTLTSSGISASLMSVKKGCTIVITLFTYNG